MLREHITKIITDQELFVEDDDNDVGSSEPPHLFYLELYPGYTDFVNKNRMHLCSICYAPFLNVRGKNLHQALMHRVILHNKRAETKHYTLKDLMWLQGGTPIMEDVRNYTRWETYIYTERRTENSIGITTRLEMLEDIKMSLSNLSDRMYGSIQIKFPDINSVM